MKKQFAALLLVLFSPALATAGDMACLIKDLKATLSELREAEKGAGFFKKVFGGSRETRYVKLGEQLDKGDYRGFVGEILRDRKLAADPKILAAARDIAVSQRLRSDAAFIEGAAPAFADYGIDLRAAAREQRSADLATSLKREPDLTGLSIEIEISPDAGARSLPSSRILDMANSKADWLKGELAKARRLAETGDFEAAAQVASLQQRLDSVKDLIIYAETVVKTRTLRTATESTLVHTSKDAAIKQFDVDYNRTHASNSVAGGFGLYTYPEGSRAPAGLYGAHQYRFKVPKGTTIFDFTGNDLGATGLFTMVKTALADEVTLEMNRYSSLSQSTETLERAIIYDFMWELVGKPDLVFGAGSAGEVIIHNQSLVKK